MALHALLHLDFGDGNFQLLPPIVRQVSDIALISKEVNNAADASVVVSHEGTQPAVGVDQRKFQADKRRRTVWITLAASILLLVTGFMLLRHTPGSPWHSATASQKANLDQQKEIAEAKFSKNETHSVAVLGQASRVSWTDRHLPTEIGASLEPGEFKLKQGLVQIEFFSGAHVIIEGPAEFELVSPSRIVCNLGKIRRMYRVKPRDLRSRLRLTRPSI